MLQKCYEFLYIGCINTHMSDLVTRSAIVRIGHRITHCRNWSRAITPSRAPPLRRPMTYIHTDKLETGKESWKMLVYVVLWRNDFGELEVHGVKSSYEKALESVRSLYESNEKTEDIDHCGEDTIVYTNMYVYLIHRCVMD